MAIRAELMGTIRLCASGRELSFTGPRYCLNIDCRWIGKCLYIETNVIGLTNQAERVTTFLSFLLRIPVFGAEIVQSVSESLWNKRSEFDSRQYNRDFFLHYRVQYICYALPHPETR